jgi:hypothetical protein
MMMMIIIIINVTIRCLISSRGTFSVHFANQNGVEVNQPLV